MLHTVFVFASLIRIVSNVHVLVHIGMFDSGDAGACKTVLHFSCAYPNSKNILHHTIRLNGLSSIHL